MIAVADYVVDLGLGAGEQGGRIVFAGTLDELLARPAVADREVPAARARRSRCRPRAGAAPASACGSLGATEHNLKNVDVAIPLNTMTSSRA